VPGTPRIPSVPKSSFAICPVPVLKN